jgi:hypothetical protein
MTPGLTGPKILNLLAVAMFFWGWRDCNEEGDDRISGTYADGDDDVSRIGSSEFDGNTDSAVSLKTGPEPKLCLPAIECVASNIGNHSVTRWRTPYS